MKSNWALRTNDHQLDVHRKTLQALGYNIYSTTLQAEDMKTGVYLGLSDTWSSNKVQRSQQSDHPIGRTNFLDNISDFLKFHFAKEKTPQEKELDTLNQQLVELQAQIEVVKQTIAN